MGCACYNKQSSDELAKRQKKINQYKSQNSGIRSTSIKKGIKWNNVLNFLNNNEIYTVGKVNKQLNSAAKYILQKSVTRDINKRSYSVSNHNRDSQSKKRLSILSLLEKAYSSKHMPNVLTEQTVKTESDMKNIDNNVYETSLKNSTLASPDVCKEKHDHPPESARLLPMKDRVLVQTL